MEILDGGCGTDTQETQMTCVEINVTDIRRNDANTAAVHACSASTNSDETFVQRGIQGMRLALDPVWCQPVFHSPEQKMLTLDRTESSRLFVPSALFCLWKEWKT